MNIVFNSLYKIDIESQSVTLMPRSNNINDLTSYVKELVTKILDNSDKKGYKFRSNTTQIKNLLDKILKNDISEIDVYDDITKEIAERLLLKEVDTQIKINKLGKEILKGIIVVSLIQFDDKSSKIIISKADHDDFIDFISLSKRSGLPIKKKIYKAFIAEFDSSNTVTRTSVYDTNSTFSVYWWRDFLELEEVYTNEYNTERAFDVIQDKILNPVKKVSKPDYINLWNTTIHYFRCKAEFSLDEYIDTIIKNYLPYDEKVKIGDLEKLAKNLPDKNKFDSRFEIVSKLINKKFKKSIQLTPQIDLLLKQDITDINNIIKPYKEDDGTKWLMIKSDEGYEIFNSTLDK